MNCTARMAIPVVVGGILKDNKILLLKRRYQPFKGLWGLPGGKINFGEFADEAIRREVREETSLQLTSVEYMGVVSENVRSGESVIASHAIYVFSCRTLTENVNSSEEGEVRWFSHEKTFRLNHGVIPTDLMIIKRMILDRAMGYYNCSVCQKGRIYEVTSFEKVA